MAVQSDLYTILSGDSNLTSLVTTNIYPQVRPQDAGSPCVVYQEIATEGSFTLGGVALDEQSTYQLVAMAADYGVLVQVVAAVKDLAGSAEGDIQRLQVDEGPAGYDFVLGQFTQALVVILSI